MEKDLIEFIIETISFPDSKICKHFIASNLLSILEDKGLDVSDELASSVFNAEDEKALELLRSYKWK